MPKFYQAVIKYRNPILLTFLILCVLCVLLKPLIAVNYDMNAYLPEDSDSTVSLQVMQEEFTGAIPNARVMIEKVTIPEALSYKKQLEAIEGVTGVTWLDDTCDVTKPLETFPTETVETYYKDNAALYQVSIDKEDIITAVAAIREIIGPDNAMTGSAVSQAAATNSTVSEIQKIAAIGIAFALFILMLTTNSWVEPVVVLLGLCVAVVINAGTNLIFGEISFVTNAAGNILQLAVSLDYSVFLIQRFEECRQTQNDPEQAMEQALHLSASSILASGLTTVIGFLALVLMRYRIGADLGLALAKGIAISLITVFVFMPGWILTTFPLMDKTRHPSFVPSFRGFGQLVRKITLPLTCIFTLLIIPSYLASINNSYYFGSSHIFAEGTQIGDDTAAIKARFGKGDTYVLLVPRGDRSSEAAMSGELKNIDGVTGIISFVDNAGVQIPYEYLDADTLALLESDNYSRLVLSVAADYEGEETVQLITSIRAVAEKYYPDGYYLAGEGVSTKDLKDTVTQDMVKVNLLAVGAVFVILIFSLKNKNEKLLHPGSLTLPLVLVLTIETAIWVNLSFPYYMDNSLFYIAYLIISSIQLGATVDYAILFTHRYKENRENLDKGESIVETISQVTVSVLTSGMTLTVVGFLLGFISSHELLSQLGFLLGRGTLCSQFAVLFVLPGYLYIFDRTFIGRSVKEQVDRRKK